MSRTGPRWMMASAGAMCLLLVQLGCSRAVKRVGPQPEPVFYPLPPAPPRIVYLTSIDDETFLGREPEPLARFLFGHDTRKFRTITKPFGLAAGNETLLVCDTQQAVVHVLNFKARRFETMGADGQGRLLKPVSVALDEEGNRFVADTFRHQVVVFSSSNGPLRALGPAGEESFKPVAVAYREGKLYVVNGARDHIEVLDPKSGEVLGTFGDKGQGPDQMLFPGGLALDAAGRIYVTDMLNCRIQVFSPDGRWLRSFGQAGDRAGELARPKHLAIAPDDIIYVVDAAFQRVPMFDAEGRVLMLFGGPGDQPGAMTLPAGICVDSSLLPYFKTLIPRDFQADYLIFVSCQFGPRKIGVYAFGRMRGQPFTVPTTNPGLSSNGRLRGLLVK